jgi:hypothetical protein
VRLGRETPHVAYPVPMILAASMGPMAEDLGEGGVRGFHLRFDASVEVGDLPLQRPEVAQDLRGQPPAQACRGALGAYAVQDARCPLGRERPSYPAGEEVPEEPVEAALSALVRSATRSSRASLGKEW